MEPTKPTKPVNWFANAPMSPYLVVGYGCYWAWTRLAFQSTVLSPSEDTFDFLCLIFVVSAVANVLTVLLCILVEKRLELLGRHRATVILASALASLGSAMIVVSSGLTVLAPVALALGAALTGIGTGILVLFLGVSFGALDLRSAALNTPLSWVFAIAVYLIVVRLPLVPAIVIAIILPILSGASLFRATGGDFAAIAANPEPLRLKRLPRDIKIASGVLFLYSVAFMVMSTFFQSGGAAAIAQFGQYSLLGGGVVALLLTVGTVLFPRRMYNAVTYRAVLPLTLAGLLLIPLLGASQAAGAMTVLGAGHVYLFIVTWVVLSGFTYRLGLSAIKVFGMAQLMFVSAVLISVPLGRFLAGYAALGDRQWAGLPIVIALLLATTAMLTLSEDRTIGGWGLADAVDEPAEGTRQEGGAWVRRCRAAAEAHGLSVRETEVMIMLAKGRSLPHIQETLHIASGTAHTHARHIYAKLDIHSRQELLDLIESGPAADGPDRSRPAS